MVDPHSRILELYAQKPGLSCRGIARRLNLEEEFVQQCLGYAPVKSLVAYTEPPEWFRLRCR